VAGLGAFAFELSYNQAILNAQSVSPGAFLGSSGRTVNCLAPEFLSGTVRWTCLTLGSSPPGASGSGVLAHVNFAAVGEGVTALDLHGVTLTGIAGQPIPASTVDGSRAVGPCDGPCPTATPTFTASPTPTYTNTPTPTPSATPCPGSCPTSTHTTTPAPTNTPAPVLPVTLRVSPASQSVTQSGTFSVDVVVENVNGLGAYEVGIQYDESVLSFSSAEDGSFLGSSGRTVTCPIFSSGVGSVRLACATLGAEPAGPSGNGVLATFVFLGETPGASTLTLASPVITFINGAAISISSVVSGSITVDPCGGPCPTATPTPTPGTPTATPTPGGVAVIGASPPTPDVTVGEEFTVDVTIDNATGVAAYEVVLVYAFSDLGNFEPNVLEFVAFEHGDFLGSTGRTVTCLPPTVDLLSVRIGCVTSGSSPPAAGGAGVLASATFRANTLSFRPMVVRVDATTGGPSGIFGDALPFFVGGASTVTISPPSGTIALAGGLSEGAAADGGSSGGPGAVAGLRRTLPSGTSGPAMLVALAAISLAVAARLRRQLAPAVAITAAVMLMGGVLVAPRFDAGASGGATVAKSPDAANLFLGGPPLTVEERAIAVGEPGLGAFDLQVSFNASVVSITATEGPFLASTGNATECTTQYPSPGQLNFSCEATGAPPSGPTGAGVLALLHVVPRASLSISPTSNNAIVIALDDVAAGTALWDVTGAAVPLAQVGDATVAVRALEGDVNTDCIVDVIDDQLITARYQTPDSGPGYHVSYDLEPADPDGDIDIKDVQFLYGRHGSNCLVPLPPQSPPGVPATDTDGDLVFDTLDNCVDIGNPMQHNGDAAMANGPAIPGDDHTVPRSDALGDACDADDDNDALPDAEDVNPLPASGACGAFAGSSDGHGSPAGGDGTTSDGDSVSADTDGDHVRDGAECSAGTNPRLALAADRSACATLLGGEAGADADADGLVDAWEVCAWGTSSDGPGSTDSDGDGLGDCQEAMDVNGTGVANNTDAILVLQAFFGLIPADWALDINGSAWVNAIDAVFIRQAFFAVNPCL
jgi:hypothetical protein